jgi:hypothetical protein
MLLMFDGTYELGTEGIRYFHTHEACHEWVISDENRAEMIKNYKDKNVETVTPICVVNTRQTEQLVDYIKVGI